MKNKKFLNETVMVFLWQCWSSVFHSWLQVLKPKMPKMILSVSFAFLVIDITNYTNINNNGPTG